MSTTASHQLEEIHTMLASGHRSIRMERHTLIFWGVAAAFLILTTETIFTLERFPVVWQLIVAMNLYISSILFAVGVLDLRMTRRLRQEREESISFVQYQLTKVWWMLVGLIVVINIGMNFFGGGQIFYGICLVLVGLSLYIHGLFSQQMLTWGGIMLIVIGLSSMAFLTSYGAYGAQKYLAASAFGLGLPLLSIMIDRADISTFNMRRWLLSLAWLLAVLTPALLAYQWFGSSAGSDRWNSAPTLSIEAYSEQAVLPVDVMQIVEIPAGSVVPFRFTLSSELLSENSTMEMPITLDKSIQVAVENGLVKGYYQHGEGVRNLQINKITMEMREGAYVDMLMNLTAKQ